MRTRMELLGVVKQKSIVWSFIALLYFALCLPFVAAHNSLDLPLLALLWAVWISRQKFIERQRERLSEPYLRAVPLKNLMLLGVFGIAAYFRLSDLNYNGPYMDELLNMEVATVGNVHYIASDTRLWPVLGFFSNSLFGLAGMRAMNALIGILSVYVLALFAESLFRAFRANSESSVAPLVAAFLFAISPAHIFVSKIATHDCLAVLFFLLAFRFLADGVYYRSEVQLLSSTFLFLLSFASRYFIFISFPSIFIFLACLIASRREDRLLPRFVWTTFLVPLALVFSFYILWNFQHVVDSVLLPIRQAGGESNSGIQFVSLEMLLRVLPLLVVWLLARLMKLFLAPNSEEGSPFLRGFLLLSASILPLTHLLKSSDYGMEKNLTYCYIFASILVADEVVSAFSRLRRLKRPLVPIFTMSSFCLNLLSLNLLIHPSTRPEIPMAKALSHLSHNPLVGSIMASVELDQSRWFQPKPVYDEIFRLGLHHQRAAVHGNFGGTHINWYLNHWMGRDPKTGNYFADSGTAWKKDTFLFAHKNKIPLIVAIIPEADLRPFERILNYPGYRLEGVARIPESVGVYGRVFLFLNPEWLDLDNIPENRRAYYEAEKLISDAFASSVRSLDSHAVERFSRVLRDRISELGESLEGFSLMLDFAEGKVKEGNTNEALSLFAQADEIAKDLGSPELRQSVDLRRARQTLFVSDSFETLPILPESLSQSLLSERSLGETPKEDIPRSTGKSKWLDLSPCLPHQQNDLLLFHTKLVGGKILAARLLHEDQSYSEVGEFHPLPFAQGERSFAIRAQKDSCLKRIDIQIGQEAWGPLGGSMGAEVEILAIHKAKLDPALWYR